MEIHVVKQLAGAVLATAGVLTLGYTAAIKWNTVEAGVLVRLPAVEKRVDVHEGHFDEVGKAIEALADAALVKKAKEAARLAECKKFVRLGKLNPSDCQEPEE